MFDPDDRSLYCDALKPPTGYRFDQAIATTYSLDLLTLLTVPLHLVRFSAGQGLSELLKNESEVGLYEALRRTSDRLSIFCHAGHIAVPRATTGSLLHLLEKMVHEAVAPNGGAFHAKLWVLRYLQTGDDPKAFPLLRLMVLTRNLTADRCWDLSLVVEGEPRGRLRAENRDLGEFINDLPNYALRDPGEKARARCQLLSDEVRRVDWELPAHFDSIKFHVLGRKRRKWLPEKTRAIAVISPFVTNSALQSIASCSRRGVTLISRSEELEALSQETLKLFDGVYTLNDAVETHDGEETEAFNYLQGLHAKAIIMEDGFNTTFYVGSANATDAALLNGKNIEVMAELTGKSSKVGLIYPHESNPNWPSLMSQDGLGAILVPYDRHHEVESDPEEEEAKRQLEITRAILSEGALKLVCSPPSDGSLDLRLVSDTPLDLPPLKELRCWLITLREEQGQDALPLQHQSFLAMPSCTMEALTGFIAFRASSAVGGKDVTFVVNVPLVNVPEERDAVLLRSILRNTAGFYRYLLHLLMDEEADDGGGSNLLPTGNGKEWKWLANAVGTGLPLLEEMTRAFSQNPAKLHGLRKTIDELRRLRGAEDIIPPDFLELWSTFEMALEETK